MKIICKLRLNFEVLSALRIYLRYYKLFCIEKYLIFILMSLIFIFYINLNMSYSIMYEYIFV